MQGAPCFLIFFYLFIHCCIRRVWLFVIFFYLFIIIPPLHQKSITTSQASFLFRCPNFAHYRTFSRYYQNTKTFIKIQKLWVGIVKIPKLLVSFVKIPKLWVSFIEIPKLTSANLSPQMDGWVHFRQMGHKNDLLELTRCIRKPSDCYKHSQKVKYDLKIFLKKLR